MKQNFIVYDYGDLNVADHEQGNNTTDVESRTSSCNKGKQKKMDSLWKEEKYFQELGQFCR